MSSNTTQAVRYPATRALSWASVSLGSRWFGMHVSPNRFDLTSRTERLLDDFREYIWREPEICNECFAQIRAIGEIKTKWTDLHVHEFNEYHERTESGCSERTQFEPPSDRYGTTFCSECGAESGTRWSDRHTLEDLIPHAKRLLVYTIRETPFDLDGKQFGRELRKLKNGPRGHERVGRSMQCLAVAWARAIE